MLKYAGYDGIVVSGISEKPVYLRIEDGAVSLEAVSYTHLGVGHYAGETELDLQGKYVCPGLVDGQSKTQI